MAKGTTIDGRYELDPRSVRRGGMGEVWFGYDTRLDRPIAMKFIRIDRLADGKPDHELTRRFVRESRITARLEHPGVPAVYDCGTHDGELYLVMQLVDGCPVNSLIDEVPDLPVAWAAAIAAQVCAVLAVAHAHSLAHRDLKPANLMLCRDGTVKVLDFGVAAVLSPEATRLTATGIAPGTPEYMAPEQAMGGTVGPQSDLYSLGVILDELLTGENQFAKDGGPPLAILRRHTDSPPRPLRERRADVPPELERLVLRLLAKTPDERVPSADIAYAGLLDFCREIPPLPGYVDDDAPNPARMYATVVGRIARPGVPGTPRAVGRERARPGRGTARPGIPPENTPPRGTPGPPNLPAVRHSDLAVARKNADALKAESRFSQAAGVLIDAIGPAAKTFGANDPAVIELRTELADVLFLGGDYRRAAAEFRKLARDLAERHGPDHDLVLRFRLMEARSHAVIGETGLALTQLNRLLADEQRIGVEEERILELRHQIGLLQLGAGDRPAARSTLAALLPDMIRHFGPAHPTIAKIRALLEQLT